jgi:hypothetical protein
MKNLIFRQTDYPLNNIDRPLLAIEEEAGNNSFSIGIYFYRVAFYGNAHIRAVRL